ncbi:CARDB domain-containing protein [Tundrisphaera sp. TA3]|uniref:CARDB domain-containing protein n=1 Tax=Tundrisphaera sp. TA3 TaxID=3435775 RepID=UPI003EB9CE21
MSSYDRRAAGRRRAWGRGPAILRFEPLEGRQLLSADTPMADLIPVKFDTVHTANWGDRVTASGTVSNQGTATTVVPTSVDIYASTEPRINATSVLMGEIQVPAGLAPGTSYNFNQVVGMPTSAIPGSTAQPIYIAMRVDASNDVAELSETNNEGNGLGVDASVMTAAPQMPADLVGTSLGLTPIEQSTAGVLSWGDTITITAQVKNDGQGNAPPTRARVVLTPLGATPGAYNDVTIANIEVPAIPAFQSVNLVKTFALDDIQPATLGGATQYTLSLVQDGDFLTQPIYPRVATQGTGKDTLSIAIAPGPKANSPVPALANLAPAAVNVSSTTLNWGQTFDVSTTVQNVGRADAGTFTVRFVATGVAGDVSKGFFLGDATVTGLAAGAATTVFSTVRLPAKLPYGTKVGGATYARVYAIVDPEDVINQALRTNNMASSTPVLLSVANGDPSSRVPTFPANVYDTAATAAAAAKAEKQAQIAAGKAAKVAAKKAAQLAAKQARFEADYARRHPEIGKPKPAGSNSNAGKANKPTKAQVKAAQKLKLEVAKAKLKALNLATKQAAAARAAARNT